MAPGNLDYWHEKATVALDIMATGSTSLRERVNDAWISSLVRMNIHKDVPWSLVARFAKIEERFKGGAATVEDGELGAFATEIVWFCVAVIKESASD
jgi:hypothetical protein